MDVVGGHQRDGCALVQPYQGLVDLGLHLDAVALEFQPEVLRPELVTQLDRKILGLLFLVHPEQLIDLAGQATGQAADAGGVFTQQIHVDARSKGEAVDKSARSQSGQVAVALFVARDQGQVAVAIAFALVVLLAHGAPGHIHLAAHQGLDAARLAVGVEFHRAVHVAVVRQGQSSLFVSLTGLDQTADAICTVEQGVLGMHMQVDEVRIGHGEKRSS